MYRVCTPRREFGDISACAALQWEARSHPIIQSGNSAPTRFERVTLPSAGQGLFESERCFDDFATARFLTLGQAIPRSRVTALASQSKILRYFRHR
ncbi:MAG: hypothetical protein JWP25_7122 [Bradyrhizobium sp.]|nr:hypothetical protein [Bradyrhizobium sp.]